MQQELQFMRERPNRGPKVVLTSLIDILFLLIVFYLVSTRFISMDIVNLQVSQSKDVKADAQTTSTVIVLEPGKRFRWQSGIFELKELPKKLNAGLSSKDEPSIVLVSKDKVTVQEVIMAMDYIRSIGIESISLLDGGIE